MSLIRLRYNQHACWVAAFAVLAVTASLTCRKSPDSRQSETWESRIFKKYVLDPIPKSVADIKADEIGKRGLGHIYVMHFNIQKTDAALIINSRQYEKFTSVTYHEQGYLHWHGSQDQGFDVEKMYLDLGTGGGLPLYTKERGQDKPEWFHPNDMANSVSYVAKEKFGRSTRYTTKVLTFDEDLEEAYFVEYLPGH